MFFHLLLLIISTNSIRAGKVCFLVIPKYGSEYCYGRLVQTPDASEFSDWFVVFWTQHLGTYLSETSDPARIFNASVHSLFMWLVIESCGWWLSVQSLQVLLSSPTASILATDSILYYRLKNGCLSLGVALMVRFERLSGPWVPVRRVFWSIRESHHRLLQEGHVFFGPGWLLA